jgi:putative DNA primase/helicase
MTTTADTVARVVEVEVEAQVEANVEVEVAALVDVDDVVNAPKGAVYVNHAPVVEHARQEKTQTERIEADSVTCGFSGDTFDVSQRGVFFIGKDKGGNAQAPVWICAWLDVAAKTRDSKSAEWGRLLRWRDDDGSVHQWAVPLQLLQSDGIEMRRELARMGLTMSPSKAARDLLAKYVQFWPVKSRARCVDRLGWHGSIYVTPSGSVGQEDEVVVFQNAHAIEPAFSSAGTAQEWRESVGRLAAGNSRLVFALSVAFAGPLADVAGEESGGFHFRGASSSGKTTALKVSASVWGNPAAYPRLWRATANGLEGLAALHNDGLLILDELSQIDPKEAGEAAYLLANGQGKARASRDGTARQSARWVLLFLSAGEESLTALMARAGRKANAGQEIRLADIDADAGAGMGAFEVLHDYTTPAALALAVKDAAMRNHGAVGREWLGFIVSDRATLAETIAHGITQFVNDAAPHDAAGQVLRVARRFALVAVAGELASHFGLTGWINGEAMRAAHKCFAAWLDSFGGSDNREERNILAQVRAYFETHGASRFEDIKATQDQRILNRAGFYRTAVNGEREFLVLSETFKREVCNGFDIKTATRVLVTAGWINPGKDGKTTQKPRVPGLGTPRCYVFTSKMWEGE